MMSIFYILMKENTNRREKERVLNKHLNIISEYKTSILWKMPIA